MSRSPPAPSPPSLSPSDTKACSQMLAELSKHASAWPFKTPVDPVLAGAPDYFDIIQRPMDLSTVERKLANFQYSEVQEFANDIQLMLNNCFTYNPPTNGVHQLGKSLESYFS
ncbi:Bromodomain-containing protein, partial [Powellomyces hirtus]